MPKDRNELEIAEKSGYNNIKATVYDDDGEVYLTIDNPWAGDTETGFGRDASVSLDKEQAAELAVFLANFVKR